MSMQTKTNRALPSFFISKTEASTRIQNYLDTKLSPLTTLIEKAETKAIWYSINHLQNLAEELIYLNADGLRIYFGTYSDDHPDFAKQMCLIMVPTRLNSTTQKHVDIILEDEEEFNKRPGSEKYTPGNETSVDKNYNYGSPCPPVCSSHVLKYPL